MGEALTDCSRDKNIAPILADANKTDLLKERICTVDAVYQDVAQKNQVEIFLKNAKLLEKGIDFKICFTARSLPI